MDITNKDELRRLGLGLSEQQIEAIANQAKADTGDVYGNPIEVEQAVDMSRPTPIEQLMSYAGGNLVRLPDFSEGQPFVAKLKRPSLLVLMKNGKIPNALISTAANLFNGKSNDNGENSKQLEEMYRVMTIIAEASLISPSFNEIKEAGIELTDEQLIAIFNYSQKGVTGLQSFRK